MAPGLIGQPLGTPARRLWALGLDLAAIGLLSSLSNLWLLGGLAMVVLLLRSDRGSTRWRRGVGWVFAVLLLLLALEQLLMWRGWHPFQNTTPAVASASAARGPADEAAVAAPPVASAAELGRLVADEVVAQVVGQVAPAVPAAAASRVAAQAAEGAGAEVNATAQDAARSPGQARIEDAARALALQTAGVPARAASASDAERVAQLEALLLKRAEAAGEDDGPGDRPHRFSLQRTLDEGLDSLGISFAWGIVYFSLLPALWGGQTLGKKLLGLRVVELTGQPITVMRGLRRYGGYAAGMATGGLGFLQVLFDPNRQGIQDRTAHTVVLDVRPSVAALALAAGGAAAALAVAAAPVPPASHVDGPDAT